MSVPKVKDAIRDTLKALKKDDFEEFCSCLTDSDEKPRIWLAEVEGKSRIEVTNFLVSRCTEAGARDRTITTLKNIGCNNDALQLESRLKLKSKDSSVTEPDLEVDQEMLESDKVEVSLKSKPSEHRSAKDIIRKNKTAIISILSGDQRLILNKVHEHELITQREYNNLKEICKGNVEEHIIELVDKIMDKGDERCQRFLKLLETDDDIKETYPKLKSLKLSHSRPITTTPVQETCAMDTGDTDDGGPKYKKTKMDEVYPVKTSPRGICLIINNVNFEDGSMRRGTEKDADDLAKLFSWLDFRVLMCVDQTDTKMSHVLTCFSTLTDISELKQLSLKEWSEGFVDLQEPMPKHGDVFVCCILSHGTKGAVSGTNREPLTIQDITRTFKASKNSPLSGKPKVFLIQACQGEKDAKNDVYHGGVEEDLEDDAGPSLYFPEEADVLVAVATVEGYLSYRNTVKGSWFIQSLCQQLKEGCSRSDDIHSILQRVNNEVGQKEGFIPIPGRKKQMPEIRYTLRKKLILSPPANET